MTMDSRATNQAMISVIEKARGRKVRRYPARLLSVVLMAVFFIALMLNLAAGARMYRSTVTSQARANELHLESGLIANVIRYNDVADTIREGEGPEGRSLVLVRSLPSRTYETRIYVYEGQLMQEFSAAGRPYNPRGATALMEVDHFDFSIEGGLVTISCDDSSFSVALRSKNNDGSPRKAETPTQDAVGDEPVTIIGEGGM